MGLREVEIEAAQAKGESSRRSLQGRPSGYFHCVSSCVVVFFKYICLWPSDFDTGRIMSRLFLLQLRNDFMAFLAGQRAARIKDASGRRCQMARQFLLDQARLAFLLDGGVEDGRRVQ